MRKAGASRKEKERRMGNAIWGFQRYAKEIFDSQSLDICCFVRDEYSEEGELYRGCPAYEEEYFSIMRPA